MSCSQVSYVCTCCCHSLFTFYRPLSRVGHVLPHNITGGSRSTSHCRGRVKVYLPLSQVNHVVHVGPRLAVMSVGPCLAVMSVVRVVSGRADRFHASGRLPESMTFGKLKIASCRKHDIWKAQDCQSDCHDLCFVPSFHVISPITSDGVWCSQ